jgi:hypothetical protein
MGCFDGIFVLEKEILWTYKNILCGYVLYVHMKQNHSVGIKTGYNLNDQGSLFSERVTSVTTIR